LFFGAILQVQTNNENAMEFYEHFGFQKVHELKNYYKVGFFVRLVRHLLNSLVFAED